MADATTDVIRPEKFRNSNLPEIETQEILLCPTCHSEESHPYASGFDYELLTCRNCWHFVCCDQCSHVWLTPRPAVSALSLIYPENYYAYSYEEKISPLAVWGKQLLDRWKMRSILRRCQSPPQSYVDVGCGTGRFLRVLEQQGIPRSRLYGIELDGRIVKQLRDEGYQAYCTRVEECRAIGPDTMHLATMFHVIEHVADPFQVVGQIVDWLSPGGIMAVETPNIESLDASIFRRSYWGGYHIPRHWNLFTPNSLETLLTMCGLELVETIYQTGHSFWMYSVHHGLRYGRRPRPQLARHFDPFQGLPFLMAFTAFDKLRAAVGMRTSAMLMIARKR